MKNTFACIISFFLFFSALAQYDPAKINKKAVQLYQQAQDRIENDNLASAAGLLLQAVEIDKNYADAYISLAAVYAELKSYRSSVKHFESAFAVDSNYTIDYKMMYSVQLAGMGEFQKALDAINELLTRKPPKNPTSLERAEKRKRSYQFAVNYAREHPDKNYVFEPKNAGSSVNTAESEYFPSLTIDGSELVFTRRVKEVNEDFYFSKAKNGEWETARPIDAINTPGSEAGQNISQDGQWLVFTANNRQGGYGEYDLYISFLTPDGWGTPINLGGTVNSDQWDSQPSLSPDKKDLYFASRRFGGMGGTDIYVCHLQPDNRWGAPENLGPSINTAGDDQCPFMHADNQTLYFVSNGWQGYGGNDLFVARRGYNNKWEKPLNLGYPVNTINDEGTLFIAADGVTAYYASDRNDSKGGHDIYSFELRQDLRPFRTLWVKGRVFDQKTGEGLQTTIELADLANRQMINRINTDKTGEFLVTLPVGKDYMFNVSRKGYLFFSDNFFMREHAPDSTYEKNIGLQPIEANAKVVLKNVFFDVNKFELKTESQLELDKLVQLLNDNPTVKIEIGGHTDNVGKPSDNLTLSNNRAKSVINYLVSKGIKAERLVAKGYGETKPVADNKTEQGRAMNRRTEMKVIGK